MAAQAPPSVRRRFRAAAGVLRAIGWPSLFAIGLALPDRLETPRAVVLSVALSLFVFERLDNARARRDADDLAAFARAIDAEDALASTLFVVSEAPPIPSLHLELEPEPPPRAWRRRIKPSPPPAKRPPWPPLPAKAPARPPPLPRHLQPPQHSPSSEVTTTSAPLMRLPRSQRPTVPESMRTIHVDLLERSRRG